MSTPHCGHSGRLEFVWSRDHALYQRKHEEVKVIPAALSTPASSAPSSAPARTPEPPSAGSCHQPALLYAPAHTTPPCTDLRCHTANTAPQGRRISFVTPDKLLLAVKPESGGNLLLIRHITPLSRRNVVYFYSGVHSISLPPLTSHFPAPAAVLAYWLTYLIRVTSAAGLPASEASSQAEAWSVARGHRSHFGR